MPNQPTDANSARRMLTIVWVAMLGASAMYWMLMPMIPRQAGDAAAIKPMLLGLAGVMAAVVLYLRLSRIGALLSSAAAVSAEQITRLRVYYILCYALSEAVVLYGFVLYMTGSSPAEAVPFFIGGIALLLLCYPRMPQGRDSE